MRVGARTEDHRFDDAPIEQLAEVGGGSAAHDAGAAARQGAAKGGDGPPPIEQCGDGRHRQPSVAMGSGCLPGPARPDRHQRAGHLAAAPEHPARVVVAQLLQRLFQRQPLVIGDPLVFLRDHVALGALEEEEMAELVDGAPAEAEMPVDDPDRPVEQQGFEAGLLAGLAEGRRRRSLLLLEVPLGEAPMAVGVLDQEEMRLGAEPPKDDPARAHFPFRLPLGHRARTPRT